MRTRLNALVRTAKGMPVNCPIDMICMERRVIDRYGAADTDNVRYIYILFLFMQSMMSPVVLHGISAD